ncbi:G-patch domain and KOW motifs-containing protein [Microplitis demolitor]|uniref:G-patch domain and KOW motifs-containing protein n=1 Tax=Microplitis demolitor TaxID=69319 RepID=UPI0004CDA83F|nr:G-patch domain and KOW motifs-containing protein [Microplitis demolitor]
MAQEGKKISFGFSKVSRKPVLNNKVEDKPVDYIKCIDDKSIKLINETKVINGPLVIPLLQNKSWRDRILDKVNSSSPSSAEASATTSTTAASTTSVSATTSLNIKQEPNDEVSLEKQAADEIIKELSKEIKVEQKDDLKIPTAEADIFAGEKESSLEDYEQIPIEQFGLAMLRGMGWQPDKGIGKNPRLVTTVVPASRPKGMGLGADKALKKPAATDKNGEKLKLEKGCFVKINAGKFVGHHGVLEGFDEDAGRVLVKLSLQNNVESFNEFIVDRVSKDDYAKNSKVINISKYEEYKNKSEDKESNGSRSKSRSNSELNGSGDRVTRDEDRHDNSCDKYKKRDRDRDRDSDRRQVNDYDDKYKRRDKDRDRSGDRRDRHKSKKSKHHKKSRH